MNRSHWLIPFIGIFFGLIAAALDVCVFIFLCLI
jgi:cobalamin synthase